MTRELENRYRALESREDKSSPLEDIGALSAVALIGFLADIDA
ncbi:MAG: hypothetical protein ACREAS_09150 [Nitrososphaera sp.]